LFAAAHEDDAFDGVVVILVLVLKTENAEARSVANFDAADVLDANWRTVAAADNHFANVVRVFDEAKTANIVKLAALRVEASAGIELLAVRALRT
jgi:hypothetical protein